MPPRKLDVVRDEPTADSPNQLTIEELAQQTGFTVRNIRSHQARELLPPPEVRQRVGYYGPDHVARLRLIQELQADGFNLKGIQRLLDDSHATAERLLEVRQAATAPVGSEEEPEVVTLEELAERFGTDPELLTKARKLGLMTPLGENLVEVASPALLEAAEEVVQRGISSEDALKVTEQIDEVCTQVSRRFVKLFLDQVWEPFAEEGTPDERWSEVAESIERLRPVAAKALLAVFQLRMAAEVESALGDVTKRLSQGRG